MEEPAQNSAPAIATAPPPEASTAPRSYIPPEASPPELTWQAVAAGSLLGIVFGASSLYLVLKVGLTVSASIPVAVLSITLFRAFSAVFGVRKATILENNIAQTAGSAGESIAFGVGVTMPVLLTLGFDMDLTRVMLVAVLGGLLGILMMIPLRRIFIVQQHRELRYPEGTACAEVLIAGEEGGASARTVFAGFGVAFLFKILTEGTKLVRESISVPLKELKGAVFGMDVAPELLGVGYIIGTRISSVMVAGSVLGYLILAPMVVIFSSNQSGPILPEKKLLVSQMDESKIRGAYILYIGAGAVATAGIISMFRVLPLIVRSARAGLRDIATSGASRAGAGSGVPRTERDLSMRFVVGGTLALILAIWACPPLHMNLLGALLIVFFGFLFVTVSSRLTGEIGSSSNPISGMTVATLLITCLIFLSLGWTTPQDRLTALSVAAIVCIASSNGGTTSQDLKTGHLVGGTPRYQQIAILIGALASALVIGSVLKVLNDAGTVYTQKDLPSIKADVSKLSEKERVRGPGSGSDTNEYLVWRVTEDDKLEGVEPGKYLVDDAGKVRYRVDPAILGKLDTRDDGTKVRKFDAPKTKLMSLIIQGVLKQELPWALLLLGAFIAITIELSGIPSLAFAVGVYLPLSTTTPIFVGGLVRFAIDRYKKWKTGAGETDSSPGVLLSSGYIAGGTIAGVCLAFMAFSDAVRDSIDIPKLLHDRVAAGGGSTVQTMDRIVSSWSLANGPALAAFALLIVFLLLVAGGKLLAGGQAPRGRSVD